MFSSRETFFPRKKKKFFKNFPQIHKFSKISPYGRTRTRVDSAPLRKGLNAADINKELDSVYMDDASSYYIVAKWLAEFKEPGRAFEDSP